MKKLVSHDEMVKFAEGFAGIFGQGMKEMFGQLEKAKASLRDLEDKVQILMNTPGVEVEPPAINDVGPDKDYPGHGWYKATDTGIIYNKGVPEGETHVFSDGDPIAYLSVYTKEDAVDNIYIAATSNVTDLSSAFFNEEEYKSTYIGQNLSHWDVSNVTNFEKTFFYTQAEDIVGIGSWKTSSAINMDSMFAIAAKFNTDISGWDVSNVTDMDSMFAQARVFNQDISGWDVSNVENMNNMFNFADKFNQDLSQWCVAKIPARPEGWEGYENVVPPVWGTCPRGEDGSNPKTEPADQGLAKDYPGAGWYKATDTGVVYNVGVPEGETYIFEGDPTEYLSIYKIPYNRGSSTYLSDMAEHHANLERYATSNMTDMEMMFHFYNSSLMGGNGKPKIVDVSHYDVSNVTNMEGVFQQSENTTFKGVEGWDVSNVTNLDAAFSTSTFNQDIGGWDVSNVVSMESAFNDAREFNQDISKWDVSNVTDMRAMFNGAKKFNQDINNWNTSNVTDMSNMFNGASVFNQDLSQWCVSKITSEPRSFYANASAWTLPKPAWGTCPRGEALAMPA